MTFLDEYRTACAADASDEAGLPVVRDWLLARPEAMFEHLREHDPTFAPAGMAFVTRYHDVVDVLGRGDAFSVSPYGEAMRRINRGADFLLGLDDGPEYRRELARLSGVFRRDDAERIRERVATRASDVLDAAMAAGRLDLADGYGRLVPALVVGDYFGVPGPDPATLARWARAIFTDAFVNVLGVPALSRRAMRASGEFRRYLDGLIARTRAERAGGVTRDDVLGRLLARQEAVESDLTDARIRDDLLWCIAGMIDNIGIALCRVADLVLEDATRREEATAAVRAEDGAALRSFVLEALRFHTPTPVVTRRCTRAYAIAKGTRHERTIASGTLVFLGLGAAMMDGTALDAPTAFRMDRPEAQYLHFGAGVHQCLGKHIALAHVTEMTARLLQVPALRRSRGIAGRLRCVGPFPKPFLVDLRDSGQ